MGSGSLPFGVFRVQRLLKREASLPTSGFAVYPFVYSSALQKKSIFSAPSYAR